jgi:hypothetical protein
LPAPNEVDYALFLVESTNSCRGADLPLRGHRVSLPPALPWARASQARVGSQRGASGPATHPPIARHCCRAMSCSQKNRPIFPWRIVSAERRLRNNLSSCEGFARGGPRFLCPLQHPATGQPGEPDRLSGLGAWRIFRGWQLRHLDHGGREEDGEAKQAGRWRSDHNWTVVGTDCEAFDRRRGLSHTWPEACWFLWFLRGLLGIVSASCPFLTANFDEPNRGTSAFA